MGRRATKLLNELLVSSKEAGATLVAMDITVVEGKRQLSSIAGSM